MDTVVEFFRANAPTFLAVAVVLATIVVFIVIGMAVLPEQPEPIGVKTVSMAVTAFTF